MQHAPSSIKLIERAGAGDYLRHLLAVSSRHQHRLSCEAAFTQSYSQTAVIDDGTVILVIYNFLKRRFTDFKYIFAQIFIQSLQKRRVRAKNMFLSLSIDIITNWLFTVRFTAAGRLALWYHVYGSLWTAKCMQTKFNYLIITREAGLPPHEPSFSYDVYTQPFSKLISKRKTKHGSISMNWVDQRLQDLRGVYMARHGAYARTMCLREHEMRLIWSRHKDHSCDSLKWVHGAQHYRASPLAASVEISVFPAAAE